MAAGLLAHRKSQTIGHYASYTFDKHGSQIRRLGNRIPAWIRQLSCDGIELHFEEQIKKGHWRLEFAPIARDIIFRKAILPGLPTFAYHPGALYMKNRYRENCLIFFRIC